MDENDVDDDELVAIWDQEIEDPNVIQQDWDPPFNAFDPPGVADDDPTDPRPYWTRVYERDARIPGMLVYPFPTHRPELPQGNAQLHYAPQGAGSRMNAAQRFSGMQDHVILPQALGDDRYLDETTLESYAGGIGNRVLLPRNNFWDDRNNARGGLFWNEGADGPEGIDDWMHRNVQREILRTTQELARTDADIARVNERLANPDIGILDRELETRRSWTLTRDRALNPIVRQRRLQKRLRINRARVDTLAATLRSFYQRDGPTGLGESLRDAISARATAVQPNHPNAPGRVLTGGRIERGVRTRLIDEAGVTGKRIFGASAPSTQHPDYFNTDPQVIYDSIDRSHYPPEPPQRVSAPGDWWHLPMFAELREDAERRAMWEEDDGRPPVRRKRKGPFPVHSENDRKKMRDWFNKDRDFLE
jgi:hypothetical protein